MLKRLAVVLAVLSGCATTAFNNHPTYSVRVESGDSLASIAAHFDTNWSSIVTLNKATLKDGLKVGQVLLVQPGPRGVIATEQKIAAALPTTENNPVVQPAEEGNQEHEGDIPEDVWKKKKPRSGIFGSMNSDEVYVDLKNPEFMWPVNGTVSSFFGKRGRRHHNGIDIRGAYGTPIKAAAGGKVISTRVIRGYGKTVVIDHGGYASLYAHCSKIIVKKGAVVNEGDFIAKVGATGNARGVHLHFEIRDADYKPLDPFPLLEKRLVSYVQGFMTLAQNKPSTDLAAKVLANPESLLSN